MFLREPYPVDATALADTHLVFVPASAVDRILDEDPAMARHHAGLDGQATAVQDPGHRDAVAAVGDPADHRLHSGRDADAGRTGPPSPAASVELPALKQVLASRLGMTPETFSRAMRTLTGEGLVRVDGSVVRIPDIAALDAYSRSQSIAVTGRHSAGLI